MKKLIALAVLGSLSLMGCDSQDANAQTTTTNVGNPDSANVLIIEEGYQAIIPVDANNPNPPAQPDWSQEGNVDVAPAPENAPAPANPPAPASSAGISVDESVMETSSPNSATYEMNETVGN